MKVTNTNGRRIMKLMDKGKIKMWNREDKCIGKWTRMRGEERSIVDYILGDQDTTENLRKMYIDDEGKWACRSDHVWLTAEVKWTKENTRTNKKEGRWKIREDTEWDGFRAQIDREIGKYEAEQVMIGYEKLEKIIKDAAHTHIGKSKTTMKGKCDEPRKIRKARKEMKKAGQRWRQGFGTPKAIRKKAWREYRRSSSKVKQLKMGREARIRTKWIENILKEGKQSSKSFWAKIKEMKSSENEIKQLKDSNQKVTDNPEEVKVIIQNYMKDLGQETRNGDESDSEEEWEEDEKGDIMEEEISRKEMTETIRSLKRGKACGLDDIP